MKQTDAISGKGDGWKPRTSMVLTRSEGQDAQAPSKSQVRDGGSGAAASSDKGNSKGGDDELDAGVSTPPTMMSMGPSAEACSAPGTQKEVCNTIDDDCDNKVDESCECPSIEPVACYDGPSGTLDVGSCRAGTRSCSAGVLGACLGAVLPSEEVCNGIDDDCNGPIDDLPSLLTDTKNCGSCGNECARNESCCDGRCVNPRGEDPQHCGGCGMACTQGQRPGCCGGNCVDLLSDPTCGTCSNACGLLRLGGGFVCSCRLTETEGPQCVAIMNGDEWLCR